jgi:ABC-2 type transport system ATP-binding protein
VFSLLGPNGAGKTTTVEILEGYRDPTAGFVRVLGFDPWTHPRELRQRTGVVLQECGFPNHLRVDEILEAWRAYYPHPRALDELLDVVELRAERSTLVRRLSGGQRRRLDFALVLAGDPDLIFLDEPTTGFDPEARRRCWSAIENLRALGKTVLLTTHYLDEAERLADRVAILSGGTIRAVGTVHELTQLAHAPTHISYRSPCGDRVTVDTTDVGSTLRSLLDALADLPELDVSPPTLEDTYLELVAQ